MYHPELLLLSRASPTQLLPLLLFFLFNFYLMNPLVSQAAIGEEEEEEEDDEESEKMDAKSVGSGGRGRMT